ncbi:MAG: hypothetical protein ABI461_20370 [Polyangiaceae bacterium]
MPIYTRVALRHQFAFATTIAVCALEAAVCPKTAHADPLDKKGTIIIGLDRIVPVIAITRDRVGPNSTTTASYGTAPGSGTPYNVPRLGLDVVAFGHISFGAASALRIDTGTPSNIPGADPLTTLFSFTPRVGYVAQVAKEIAFWPRAGVTLSEAFTRADTNGMRTADLRFDSAADLELSMVATPLPVLGVTMTLGAELPLLGKTDHTSPSGTVSESVARWHFVVDAGFVAHF